MVRARLSAQENWTATPPAGAVVQADEEPEPRQLTPTTDRSDHGPGAELAKGWGEIVEPSGRAGDESAGVFGRKESSPLLTRGNTSKSVRQEDGPPFRCALALAVSQTRSVRVVSSLFGSRPGGKGCHRDLRYSPRSPRLSRASEESRRRSSHPLCTLRIGSSPTEGRAPPSPSRTSSGRSMPRSRDEGGERPPV